MQENSVSIIKLYRRYYQCDIYITHIRMLFFFFFKKIFYESWQKYLSWKNLELRRLKWTKTKLEDLNELW